MSLKDKSKFERDLQHAMSMHDKKKAKFDRRVALRSMQLRKDRIRDKALREEAEIRRQEQEAESNNPLVQKIMAVLFYITAAVIILFVLGHFWSK